MDKIEVKDPGAAMLPVVISTASGGVLLEQARALGATDTIWMTRAHAEHVLTALDLFLGQDEGPAEQDAEQPPALYDDGCCHKTVLMRCPGCPYA